MSRKFTFDSLSHFDALERKLSMSALAGGVSVAGNTLDDDAPPPDPEPDPGPYPGPYLAASSAPRAPLASLGSG
jgi:hypothetical protein